MRQCLPWLVGIALPCVVAAATAWCAEPAPEQLALLKTFREEFIRLTPGEGNFPKSVQLGAANPSARPREVTISSPFYVARYEVPQKLWEQVMGANPSRWPGRRNAVERVTLAEAQEFCRKATLLLRLAKLIEDDETVRLPTEAEWEYAARAGSTTRWSFGNEAEKLGDYAWFHGNAAGNDPPVGAKQPNAWGLYDMHGYVWEWCLADEATVRPAGEGRPTDAAAPQPGCARGGSWKDPADNTTSTARWAPAPDTRDDALGLRCLLVREAKPGTTGQ